MAKISYLGGVGSGRNEALDNYIYEKLLKESGILFSMVKFRLTPKKNAPKSALRYWTSHVERESGNDYGGKPHYYPAGVVIENPRLTAEVFNKICKTGGNQQRHEFLFGYEFTFEWYYNGAKSVAWYNPKYWDLTYAGYFYYGSTPRKTWYDSIKESWYARNIEHQQEIDLLNKSIQANYAKLMAVAKKKNLTRAEKDSLIEAVGKYNYIVGQIAADKDYTMKISRVEANIGDAGVGIAPLVLVVIFIIAGAAVAVTASIISNNIRKTKQYAAAMAAQGANIDRLMQAGRELAAGKISQDTYNAVKEQVKTDNKEILEQAGDLSKNPEGFLGGIQKVLIIGIVGLVIYKVAG